MRWILFIIVYVLIDLYAFQAVRSVTKNTWIHWGYGLISLLVLGNFLMHFYGLNRSEGFQHAHTYAIGLLIAWLVPKFILVIFMFGEDLFRVPQALYRYLTEGKSAEGHYLATRRKFIGQVALGLATLPFASILYGIYRGRYNYKVLEYSLEFDDLPPAFDGYRITQISDLHCGSFDNYDKVAYGVDLINRQASDVIVFTGDMVNNKAEELYPYQELFGKLKARDGVYSVLGNHDYGDYINWPSQADKVQNLKDLMAAQRQMGFTLLNNEARYIEKDGQRIALVGVENWGTGGFVKAGDLKKAVSRLAADDFKVLLSHDPTHWDYEVLPHPYPFHLTLSGHTHGMQFGIEIPGWFKWSPVKWRYKHWAGIYEKAGQYLNVNRGFGYLAFPGRVGIWPEITVIQLKKK